MKQENLGNLIKKYRAENNLSLREFANLTSFSHTYISNLENNYNPSTKKPPIITVPALIELSNILNYDFEDLLKIIGSKTNNNKNKVEEEKTLYNKNDIIKIPVFSCIPKDNSRKKVIDHVFIKKNKIEKDISDYFATVIKNDNMYPKYHKGDIVLFNYNKDIKYGEDIIISINKDDKMLFTNILINENGIILHYYNPFFKDIKYSKNDIKKLNIEIVAKAECLLYRNLGR